MTYTVLVVEDEAVAAEAHAACVQRVPQFSLAGVARSGNEAMRMLVAAREAGRPVDLLLLDMNLPDGHGLGLLSKARASGHPCDAIAVTAARDTHVVRHAVTQGVVLYLLKPFTAATLRDKLEQYATYRAQLEGSRTEVAQDEVDRLFGTLRSTTAQPLPKGLSAETLRVVTAAVRDSDAGRSASEIARFTGVSRVTARRYLEHLAEAGLAERQPRYSGSGGRPEVAYVWR